MPRSLNEILDQADDLSTRFENHDADPTDMKDGTALRAVRQAFQARVDAEGRLADAVSVARAEGHSWSAIGAMVGTSGEAARQRYGRPMPGPGGTKERSRNEDGHWREKRSDSGKQHQSRTTSDGEVAKPAG